MAKGRPKGARNIATRAIKDIIDTCVDMSEVVDKLVELTRGVEVQVKTDQGVKVYTDKPDTQAAKILLEYRYGKPSQSVDITTGGDKINRHTIKLPDGTQIEI